MTDTLNHLPESESPPPVERPGDLLDVISDETQAETEAAIARAAADFARLELDERGLRR